MLLDCSSLTRALPSFCLSAIMFTVALLTVNPEAFADPSLDRYSRDVRSVFDSDGDGNFEVIETKIATFDKKTISSIVSSWAKRGSVDLVLTIGGIGSGIRECTSEVRLKLVYQTSTAEI